MAEINQFVSVLTQSNVSYIGNYTCRKMNNATLVCSTGKFIVINHHQSIFQLKLQRFSVEVYTTLAEKKINNHTEGLAQLDYAFSQTILCAMARVY